MNRRELLARQKALIQKYKRLYDRQANYYSDVKAWHDCEREKEKILGESDRLRRSLLETRGET